ncbi:MAG: YhfC family intramembrane metalloprotease [Oscillospiraceae bacterium]|nr:YhfC family intramembrane metalloprotease [Oscillospiraceae bacterium]
MVPVSTIVCCVITLLICLALPVLALLWMDGKYKKQGIPSAWLLGAAGFFVTQILIRVPILTVLQGQSWFMEFANSHLFLYAFGLAFTAGLFELAGRFVVAKLLRKNLTSRRALAAGLGHGGIEAIVLIGMAYVNNLIYIFMINTGYFDSLFAQVQGLSGEQLELAVSQLEMIRTQLVEYPAGMFLLGGFERILAMTAHTAMSMVVCYGVAHGKTLPCMLVCLGIHTLIDLTAGIQLLAGTVLSQTAAYIVIYAVLIVVALISLLIIRELLRRWKKEVSHASEE